MNLLNIEESFSKAARTYHSNADVQKSIAQHLFQLIQKHSPYEPLNIQELGAGTGFLSHNLGRWMKEGRLELQDISLAMLMQNQMGFPNQPSLNTHFVQSDLNLGNWSVCADWICSSSAIQWAPDFWKVLSKHAKQKAPNLKYAFSTFSPQNFSQFHKSFTQTTGQTFPSSIYTYTEEEWFQNAEKAGLKIEFFSEESVLEPFSDIFTLLKSFQNTGTTYKEASLNLGSKAIKKWEAKLPKDSKKNIILDWSAQYIVLS